MNTLDWETEMQDLEAAEDFFAFFEVPFDPHVVCVNRLHILQRFHDSLSMAPLPSESVPRFAAPAALLAAAHQDFVDSTPSREKIFRVFQNTPNQPAFVPLAALAPKP
ncbi:MAG: nitrogen fixation protein NifW [Rhodospirillaceae bacterium]|nr:nitrogen fixation protein NifW [Rhodospirillaceae bacterium]